MKALTLHQPYATAVALGIKTVETRSWRTSHRGRVAIHAGVHHLPPRTQLGPNAWTGRLHDSAVGLWRIDPDRAVADDPLWTPLPLGAVVATATIMDCVPMIEEVRGRLSEPVEDGQRALVLRRRDEQLLVMRNDRSAYCWPIEANITAERPWGDYRPGRWAWLLTDVEPLAEPVPCRGYQRLWNVELAGLVR